MLYPLRRVSAGGGGGGALAAPSSPVSASSDGAEDSAVGGGTATGGAERAGGTLANAGRGGTLRVARAFGSSAGEVFSEADVAGARGLASRAAGRGRRRGGRR